MYVLRCVRSNDKRGINNTTWGRIYRTTNIYIQTLTPSGRGRMNVGMQTYIYIYIYSFIKAKTRREGLKNGFNL